MKWRTNQSTGFGEIAYPPNTATQFQEIITLLNGAHSEHRNLDIRVRGGIESAILDAKAKEEGKTVLEKLLGDTPRTTQIPINGLISTKNSFEALSYVNKMVALGVRTFKVKCDANINELTSLLTFLNNEHQGLTFRIDPNGSWHDSVDFILDTFDRLKLLSVKIEYVEEPFLLTKDAPFLPLISKLPLPIAADHFEDLSQAILLNEYHGVQFFILKSQALGGPKEVASIIRKLHNLNLTPIVTSSLESMVGIRMAASLAAFNYNCKPVPPQGLSLGELSQSSNLSLYNVKDGCIDIASDAFGIGLSERDVAILKGYF